MQRKTKKIFDVIKIIINLTMLILMILSLTTNNDNYYAWYWIVVSAMLVLETYYLFKWTKVGEWNIDKKDSKSIRYSFDGITTGTLCTSGLLYLLVMGLELVNKSIKTNVYVIIIVSILLTLSVVFNLLAVNTANRESRELAEKCLIIKIMTAMTGKMGDTHPKFAVMPSSDIIKIV